MKARLLETVGLATAAGVLFASGVVFAQTTANGPPIANANSDTVQNSEIIVTASKREERLRDVAMGVTAISGADLNTKQLLSFEEYAVLVPGLSLQQQGNGFNRLIIRGENAGTSGATVGVYIDESPTGSSNGLARGGLLTSNVTTWDLQRVEVLRGPQGTLYGASTEGGLVKFVSASPEVDRVDATVEVGGQYVSKGELAASVKGVINIPLIDGKAALRVSGFAEQLPGYLDDPLLGKRNFNGGSRKGFRASLLYKPDDDLTIRLIAFNQNVNTGGTPFVDAVGSALTYANPPANRYSPAAGDLVQNRYVAESSFNQLENYSGIVDWNAGFLKATSITSYGFIRQSRAEDFTSAEVAPGFTYGQVLTQFFFNGVNTGLAARDFLRVRKFTQEFRIASSHPSKLEFQVGGFYTQERTYVSDQYTGFSIPSQNPFNGTDFGTQWLPSSYQEYAGFGELTYHFTSRLDLAAGGRYSYNKQSSTTFGTASPLLGPALNEPANSDGDAATYSVAPRWHITDNTLVYARVASGYRPGGPNVVPPGAPAGVPRTYGSDNTTNYEAGIRTSLFDKKLYLDLTGFYIDWSNIQVFEVVNASGVTVNAGGARSRGVEWNVGLTPVHGLNLNLVGSYIAAEITKDAPSAGASRGQALPFVPDLSTSLDGEYHWNVGDGLDAFFGGTASFVGSEYTDFGASPIFEPHAKLPSYTTLALRAGVAFRQFRFELYGKNVTDERGITGYANAAAPNLAGSTGIIQPATAGFLITTKFR